MKIKSFSLPLVALLAIIFSALVHAAPAAQTADQLVFAMVEAIRQSAPAWTDDFETLLIADFWMEDEDEESARFIEDGAYNISVYSVDQVVWSLAGDLAYTEFLLEADAQWVDGSPDNEIGFVFRYRDSENFYAYTISSDGYYSLSRRVQGDWDTLIDWSATPVIDTSDGAWNHLSLLVATDEISLLVNDQVVATTTDDQRVQGGIGLLAGVHDADGVQIAFDNFAVWDRQNLYLLESGPTVTPTPAEEPLTEATDEQLQQIELIRQREPLLHEDFRRDRGNWNVEVSDNGATLIRGGAYHIGVDTPNWIRWNSMVDEFDLADFLLEVETTHIAGPLENEMGILFRFVDADNFYYYKVSSDGYYGLDKMVGGAWETLIEWTATTAIDVDAADSLLIGLLANGPHLTFLINDHVVTTYNDADFVSGDIALAVGTFEEGGVKIAFDDLYLWTLNSTVTLPTAPAPGPTAVLPTAPANPPIPTPMTPVLTPQPPTSVVPLPVTDSLLATIKSTDPDFSDEFRRTDSGWQIFTTDEVNIVYAERTLRTQVHAPQWWGIAFNEQVTKLAATNFLLEVDTQHLSGPTDVGYGIVFGFRDAENYQRFLIAQNGYYTLQKIAASGSQDLVPWTQSAALASTPTAMNRLGLLVQGNQITLLVNGQMLAQTTDPALASGQIGLIGTTGDEGGLAVAFDNIDLWTVTTAPISDTTPPAVAAPIAVEIAPQLAAIRSAAPTFYDEFRRADSGWDTWQEELYTISYTGQRLSFAIDKPNWITWSFNPQLNTPAADFLLEVDAQQVVGPVDQGFGILFRFVDDKNYYRYLITQGGYFVLQKFVAGVGSDLIPWTQTPILNLDIGNTNRLALLVEGAQVTLLANDQVLGRITDVALADTAKSGAIGITVTSAATSGIHVAFDNLDFWPLVQMNTSNIDEPVAHSEPAGAAIITTTTFPTTTHDGGFYTLTLPVDWAVTQIGNCDTFAFLVSDPQEPLRQVFLFTSIGPFYMNEQAKQADITYMSQGGFPIPWVDAPVVDPLTPASLLAHFGQIAAMSAVREIMPRFPAIEVTQLGEVIARTTPFADYGAETALLRALIQQNGALGEGLFDLSVSPFMPAVDASGPGTAMGYLISGVTAPQHEFHQLQPTLLQVLQSIDMAPDYINQCMKLLNQQWQSAINVGKTMRAAADIYNQSWHDRNKADDVRFAKYSDYIRGVERFYDPNTGEVYELTQAEYATYESNRSQYQNDNLQPLPEENHELWIQTPLTSSHLH